MSKEKRQNQIVGRAVARIDVRVHNDSIELHPLDAGVAGVYRVEMRDVPADLFETAALDIFHSNIPIKNLDDFSIEVGDETGRAFENQCEDERRLAEVQGRFARSGDVVREGEKANRLRIVIDVEYALGEMRLPDLAAHVESLIGRAIGNGILTGQTPASVLKHEVRVAEMDMRVDEDMLAEFMAGRIENGDLDADDIPVRLARYGLMEPDQFRAEMAERMGLDGPFPAPPEKTGTKP